MEVYLNTLHSFDFATSSSTIWTYDSEEPEEKLKKNQIAESIFWIKKHQSVCTTSYCCEEYKTLLQADLLL